MSVLFICDLQMEKLHCVFQCWNMAFREWNGAKNLRLQSQIPAHSVSISSSVIHLGCPPFLLSFELLFWSATSIFFCFLFLHVLSYHLCHICFLTKLCVVENISFPPLTLSSLCIWSSIKHDNSNEGKERDSISMSGQWWIGKLKCSRQKTDTIHFSVSHSVYECAFLCNVTTQSME